MKELDYHVEDTLSKSYKDMTNNNPVNINPNGFHTNDTAEIKFPHPGLLNFNDV